MFEQFGFTYFGPIDGHNFNELFTYFKYAEKLDKHGITDDKTTTIDIDGSINPIGEKTKNLYK